MEATTEVQGNALAADGKSMHVRMLRAAVGLLVIAAGTAIMPPAAAADAASDVYVVQAELGPPGDAVTPGFSALDLSPDGSLLVVGAPAEEVGGSAGVGAVYVYRRIGTTWALEARVGAPAGARRFGSDLALSDDATTLVVGAPRSHAGGVDDAGAAMVFASDGGAWELQVTLAATPETGRRLGRSVAVSATGDTALVTRTGSAPLVFTRADDTWSAGTELPGPDALEVAVSADGTVVLSGLVANVTTLTDGTWTSRGVVHSGWGYEGDAVAITADGSRAVITMESGQHADPFAAANVLAPTPTSWHWTDEIGGGTGGWGASAAIADDSSTIAIGQPLEGSTHQPGRVHVYRHPNDRWALELLLSSPSGSPGDRFGEDVAMSEDGSIIAVSAPGSDAVSQDGGVVDVFVTAPSTTTTVTIEPLTTVPPGFDALQIVAQVYPIPSGGTLSFAIDGVAIPGCEAELIGVPWGGEAWCSASSGALGDHEIEVSFAGHGSFGASSATTTLKVRPSPTVTIRTSDDLLAPGTPFDVHARVTPVPASGTVSFGISAFVDPCRDLPVDPVTGRVSCHIEPDVSGRRHVAVMFSGNDDLAAWWGSVPIVLSTFDLSFVQPRPGATVAHGSRIEVGIALSENARPLEEHLAPDVLEGCGVKVVAFGRSWCADRYERDILWARMRIPNKAERRMTLDAVFRGWGRRVATATRTVSVSN